MLVQVATTHGHCELRRVAVPERPDAAPLLLVHGIAVNHRNLDPWGRFSLARALAAAGRDVWLLTLRSGRHELTARDRAAVDFTAMVREDLPLAAAEVLRQTGAERIDYVGFSMGGMLAYAALGRTLPERQVRRVAIIGSPGRVMPHLPRWLLRLPVGTLRLRLWAGLVAFAAEWFWTPIHRRLLQPDNCEPGLQRHACAEAVQDIPGPLLRQFADWALAGGALVVDGAPVLDGLRKVATPVHFFVGAADHLGPPAAVRVAWEAWGAETGVAKGWTLFARAEGHTADYGHVDLTIGRRAPDEVLPRIVDFLCRPGALESRAA
jgi:pimeloyl-ACP methyl ester carboxylesterase